MLPRNRNAEAGASGAEAWICLLLFLAALATARPAASGNRHSYLIGGRGAMMGGAFTAMAADASAAWYNPGGLGFSRRSSISISANAFSLSLLRVEDPLVIDTDFGNYSSDFRSLDYFVVPTSFVYVLALTKKGASHPVNLAFSVFVPDVAKADDTMKIEISQQIPEHNVDLLVRERMELSYTIQNYYIGPSLGIQAAESLGVGLSVFGVYSTAAYYFNSYLHAAELVSATEQFSLGIYELNSFYVGIGFSVGMLAKIKDFMNVGVTFRSPVFKIYSDYEATSVGGGTFEGDVFEDSSESSSGFGASMVIPFTVTLGISFYRDKIWALDFELDYTHSLDRPSSAYKYRKVVNARGGAEIFLTERIILGVGLFTDFYFQKDLTSFHDRQIDFVGGTAGVTWTTPYEVVKSKKTSRIDFSTTVGVRYSHGWGKVIGLYQDAMDDGQDRTGFVESDASVDDVAIYLGSSVCF